MGNYIALEDLDEYLSDKVVQQLTDDDGSGFKNTAIVDEAITGAEGVIDSFLSRRYDVPLASPPEVVKEMAVQLAAYRLHARRMRVPADIKDLRDQAMELLKDIRDNKQDLEGVTSDTDNITEVEFTDNDRIHDRDEWKGW